MSDGPSDHLTWDELACKDGTAYPSKFKADGRAFRLARLFERIRALYDKPIIVLSAYRTPAHNKKVGGARLSQHLEGRALDLRPPKGITVDQFYFDIHSHSDFFGIHGIGKYKTFVHVDIRPIGKLVAWKGEGVKDSLTGSTGLKRA